MRSRNPYPIRIPTSWTPRPTCKDPARRNCKQTQPARPRLRRCHAGMPRATGWHVMLRNSTCSYAAILRRWDAAPAVSRLLSVHGYSRCRDDDQTERLILIVCLVRPKSVNSGVMECSSGSSACSGSRLRRPASSLCLPTATKREAGWLLLPLAACCCCVCRRCCACCGCRPLLLLILL